jgi:SAM-dependent methyltransferase
VDQVERFYDELADDYAALFADWDASVRRQGQVIDRLVRRCLRSGARSILDCTCGIGTQAIGLSLRGYVVKGTDISGAAIARARVEAARMGVSVPFEVADVRSLPSVEVPFDVVIAFDNALPHLVEPRDLSAALSSIEAVLRPEGLFLASIRDYDGLLKDRPVGEAPRLFGPAGSRSLVTQAWEWDPTEPTYRLHQFILREQPTGDWSARHLEAGYRALRRGELSEALVRAGFRDVRWLETVKTGFYQPVVSARRL